MKLIDSDTQKYLMNKPTEYDVSCLGKVSIHHHLLHSKSMEFSVDIGGVNMMVGGANIFMKFIGFLKSLFDPFVRQHSNIFYEDNLAVKVRYYASLSDELGGRYIFAHGLSSWRVTLEDLEITLEDIEEFLSKRDEFEIKHKGMINAYSAISDSIFISE